MAGKLNAIEGFHPKEIAEFSSGVQKVFRGACDMPLRSKAKGSPPPHFS
jgi:hypothetical protein